MIQSRTEDKYVKIRYQFTNITLKDYYFGFLQLMALGALAIVLIVGFRHGFNRYIVTALIFTVLIGSLPLFVLIPRFFRHRQGRKEVKMIKKYGQRVIGTIVSLDRSEIVNNRGREGFSYSYTVQFGIPKHEKPITFKTPSIIADTMLVKEEDLPMKAVVYCWGNNYHVDSLVNPPYQRLLFRKIIKYGAPVTFVASMSIAVIAESTYTEAGAKIAAPLLIVAAISYILMITITKSTP